MSIQYSERPSCSNKTMFHAKLTKLKSCALSIKMQACQSCPLSCYHHFYLPIYKKTSFKSFLNIIDVQITSLSYLSTLSHTLLKTSMAFLMSCWLSSQETEILIDGGGTCVSSNTRYAAIVIATFPSSACGEIINQNGTYIAQKRTYQGHSVDNIGMQYNFSQNQLIQVAQK